MTIFCIDRTPVAEVVSRHPAPHHVGRGYPNYRRLSKAGDMTQFRVSRGTYAPGSQSSQAWRDQRDSKPLYHLKMTDTIFENAVGTVTGPCYAACWNVGVPTAPILRNYRARPGTYPVVGSNPENICHDLGLDLLALSGAFSHPDGTPYATKGETT